MWWSVNEIRLERAVDRLSEALEAVTDPEDPEVCQTLREFDEVLNECERLRARHLH